MWRECICIDARRLRAKITTLLDFDDLHAIIKNAWQAPLNMNYEELKNKSMMLILQNNLTDAVHKTEQNITIFNVWVKIIQNQLKATSSRFRMLLLIS